MTVKTEVYPSTGLVKDVYPESQCLLIDPEGTGIQPVVSIRACKAAPEKLWVFDDGNPATGYTDWAHNVMPTLVDIRANPTETGGRLRFDEFDDIDPREHVYQPDFPARAERHGGKWWYLMYWKGYSEPSWVTEDDIVGTDVNFSEQMRQKENEYNLREEAKAAKRQSTRQANKRPLLPDEFIDPQTFVPSFARPSNRRKPTDRSDAKDAQEQARMAKELLKDAKKQAQRDRRSEHSLCSFIYEDDFEESLFAQLCASFNQ